MREIKLCGPVALVPLGRNPEHYAIVDADDLDKVKGHSWYRQPQPFGKSAYAVRNGTDGKLVRMHRVILGIDDDREVDHRDRNGCNNVKANLRIATVSQNRQNRGVQKNNTSGYKGVTYLKDRNKWKARIKVNNKSISLGNFDDPAEAYEAYCVAAIKYHGEFAGL